MWYQVLFNHPFIPTDPKQEYAVTKAMCNNGELLRRFLSEVRDYWTKEGPIIMPYYTHVSELAGDSTNDPKIQSPKYGFQLKTHQVQKGEGLHPGKINIYEIRDR